MGLAPSEFWSLSIPEVQLQLKGAQQRDDERYRLGLFVAWHTALFIRLDRANKFPSWESLQTKHERTVTARDKPPAEASGQHWQEMKGIMAAHRQAMAKPTPKKTAARRG